jgi:hypothetical protein
MSPTGHLAIGFAAKKYAPKISLIVFLIAAYAIDLIYFIFLALGIDKQDYDPWSHSLFMAIIWSVTACLITLLFSRKLRNGLVIGLVVFSHWILDFIVWGNLPVSIARTKVIGFGLYDKIGFSLTGLKTNSGSMIATSIELGMLIIGLVIYIFHLRKLRKEKKSAAFGI